MLVRVSIDVQRAVQSSPLKANREPMVLVTALVEVGLDQPVGLLEDRGLELYSPASSSSTESGDRLPAERLAVKLLEGLMEHEPLPTRLLGGPAPLLPFSSSFPPLTSGRPNHYLPPQR